MTGLSEGNALVYCQGALGTTNGKTAHGLVRRTSRYRVVGVVDARHAGRMADEVVEGARTGIPIFSGVADAVSSLRSGDSRPTHLVIGLAPDGGRLPAEGRAAVIDAIREGLHVDSGLHDFLSENSELAALAESHGVRIRDIRKPPPRSELHFFSGKIEEVTALRVAVLGTDSAVGKRTTAWLLVDAFNEAGYRAALVGTGQTAWMQGARHGVIFDSLVNDFVSGEIEHAVWSAWKDPDGAPDVIVIEGQGSLMNPAYPSGLEILAAGRPDAVVLQHAPAREEYDGFPGYRIQPLDSQIEAIELLSGKRVVAVTVNHEGLDADGVRRACNEIRGHTGVPAVDVLRDGAASLVPILLAERERSRPRAGAVRR